VASWPQTVIGVTGLSGAERPVPNFRQQTREAAIGTGVAPTPSYENYPSRSNTVHNRLIATGAGLLGGLETLAFLIVICFR
jgi:hypothetical protein